jgi:hypothetical protein
MKIRYFLLSLSVFLAYFSTPSFGAGTGGAEKSIPFYPGEKLTFQVSWLSIPAGEAVLEILPFETINGVNSFHFSMTARTYEAIDFIYKIRDRMDSYADEGMTRSLLYKQHRDGKRKKAVTVHFDWEKKEAQYANYEEKNPPIPILPGSFDPLSVFYSFRLMPLKEAIELQAPVTDGKKCVLGKAKVIKRETIQVREVSYDTFLVEPDLEHIGGVFEKSKNARLLVWVTADEACIPVKVRSEVIVGSFVAELIKVEGRPAIRSSALPSAPHALRLPFPTKPSPPHSLSSHLFISVGCSRSCFIMVFSLLLLPVLLYLPRN